MHSYKRAPVPGFSLHHRGSGTITTAGSSDSSLSTISTKTPTSVLKTSKAMHVKPANRATKRVTFSPISSTNTIQAALDSGASANCFPSTYIGTNHQTVTPQEATKAQVANDRIITATATDSIALNHLPGVSKQMDKYDEITTPLLSVNKLCKGDLAVLFQGETATVFKPSAPQLPIPETKILEGKLDKTTELYMVDIPTNNPYKFPGGMNHAKLATTATPITQARQITIRTVPLLMQYYHKCLGAPPLGTLLQAADKGWLMSFPGLTATRIREHLAPTIETAKGHLRPQRQHVQSTSQNYRSKTHTISAHEMVDLKNLLGMDGTGRYPITSASGMQCVIIFIDCNSNYIRIVPVKSRKSEHLVEAYKGTYKWYKERGFEAQLLQLDNEISKLMIQAIKENNQEYQLASPSDHRTNPAERAIQAVKAHFISIRACTDESFPKNQWDLLLPHAEFTLNLLRPSKINKDISAHTIMHGHCDFMKHPMSIAGTKVLVHDRPMDRGSWADRGTEGFFVNKTTEHYRNYKCCMPITNAIRTSNTVEFFPDCTNTPVPTPLETVSTIPPQLKELLQGNDACNPQGGSAHALTQPLLDVQSLLGIPSTTKPVQTSKGAGESKSDTVTTRNTGPTTRSKTKQIHPIGTIISKKFSGKYFEGEAAEHFPREDLCKIKCADDDAEDFTAVEISKHKKQKQSYSRAQQLTKDNTKRALKIITKGRYQGLRLHHQLWRLSSFHHHVGAYKLHQRNHINARKATIVRALKAGCIWDEQLKKWLSLHELLNHPDPQVRACWEKPVGKELGSLFFQGFKDTKGMDVCKFIPKWQVPKNKKITKPRIVCACRPEKIDNPCRTRITAGGHLLDYDGETATNSASMETVKISLNSVLSTPGARLSTSDAKMMHLESLLKDPQCMRFKLSQIPEDFQKQCNLHALTDDQGHVCARIDGALCGLAEAGRIANQDMVDHLAKFGYYECKFTPGLFTHETRPIQFSLTVDDFAVKWIDREDFDHLLQSLETKYTMTCDMEGKQHVGISLDWNYDEREVICSMNQCVQDTLSELEVIKPKQHFKGPSKAPSINYGAKIQYIEDDTSAPLSPEQIKFIQRVIGKFLFMARAVDDTLLHALNDLACQVSKGTQKTWEATQHVLNHIACNPTPAIRHRASDMILKAESDAAFDVTPDARSRAAGYIHLGSEDDTQFNAPIHVLSKTIKGVMGSAAEAEVAALHMNAHELIPMRDCLNTLKHPQPPTRIKTDNITAKGFVQGTIKQRRSEGYNRKHWWLKDHVKEFNVTWAPGKTNLADYHSKHFTGSYHSKVRPIYLYEGEKSPTDLQGCIKISRGAHGGPARKPAISPSSQVRASRVSTSDSTLHIAAIGNDNRCSTANQCTRPGVPTWLERVPTASWNRLLHSQFG